MGGAKISSCHWYTKQGFFHWNHLLWGQCVSRSAEFGFTDVKQRATPCISSSTRSLWNRGNANQNQRRRYLNQQLQLPVVQQLHLAQFALRHLPSEERNKLRECNPDLFTHYSALPHDNSASPANIATLKAAWQRCTHQGIKGLLIQK